jgi:hypothetical protein
MQLSTFSYRLEHGWSVETFPALDSPQSLVLLFGAPEFASNPRPIETVARAYPHAQIIGCSTAGEIFDGAVYDKSLSVAVLRMERTTMRTAFVELPAASDSFRAGKALAQALLQPDLVSLFVLSVGTDVNGSELVRGLNAVLPDRVVVTGGLAGDGDRFEQTWVLRDASPSGGCVSGTGFYGDRVRVGHGSRGGWDIFGPERLVTRSTANVLYELDGKPALELYKQYLGTRAAGLPATALLFPLAVRANRSQKEHVVRTILGVDDQSQSMTFAGDIPQGSLARLMKANLDRLIDGAVDATALAKGQAEMSEPILSIAISCVGRRLVLTGRTEEELEATLSGQPSAAHQIGFYSYGEIAPYSEGKCDLHNQTMTLTMIAEG